MAATERRLDKVTAQEWFRPGSEKLDTGEVYAARNETMAEGEAFAVEQNGTN